MKEKQDEGDSSLQIRCVRIFAGKALLELANLQQVVLVYPSAQLADQPDVFADVSREATEFRIVFDESLHVGNALDVHIGLCFGLVLVDVVLDVSA